MSAPRAKLGQGTHYKPLKITIMNDFAFEYQLLSRLQMDCEYYLGCGNRNPKYLWALNEVDQIAKMKELYNIVPEKPEWLTIWQIENYAKRMNINY